MPWAKRNVDEVPISVELSYLMVQINNNIVFFIGKLGHFMQHTYRLNAMIFALLSQFLWQQILIEIAILTYKKQQIQD